MKVSELIAKLQMIQSEHGDLDLYERDDAAIFKYETEYRPKVCKMYTQKWEDAEWMRDQLTDGGLNEEDEKLHDVDLTKPIFKAVLL